jgi:hypothetical protein
MTQIFLETVREKGTIILMISGVLHPRPARKVVRSRLTLFRAFGRYSSFGAHSDNSLRIGPSPSPQDINQLPDHIGLPVVKCLVRKFVSPGILCAFHTKIKFLFLADLMARHNRIEKADLQGLPTQQLDQTFRAPHVPSESDGSSYVFHNWMIRGLKTGF